MVRYVPLLSVLAVIVGCGAGDPEIRHIRADAGTALDLDDGGIVRVAPAADAGFDYPYLLRWPPGLDRRDEPTCRHLLVVPNNTGTVDDDPAVHEEDVRRDMRDRIGEYAVDLPAAVLMPVFPRPAARPRIYTHALDRDVMTLPDDDPLARLDRELIAMIDHARGLLEASGHRLSARVLLFGYSASGTFVDRFTALHPDRVQGVAAGGVNALPILPHRELEGAELPFPIGVADVADLTGRPFDRAAWRRVPQFVFMGAEDRNDTLPFGDAWDDDERDLIATLLGEDMMPGRWDRVRELLRGEPGIELRTYVGRGHELDAEIMADVSAFLRAAAEDEDTVVVPRPRN